VQSHAGNRAAVKLNGLSSHYRSQNGSHDRMTLTFDLFDIRLTSAG